MTVLAWWQWPAYRKAAGPERGNGRPWRGRRVPGARRRRPQLPLPGRGRRGPAPTGVVRKSLAGLLRRLPEAAVAEGKGISSGSQSTTFPSPWKLHYVQHLKAWHRPARRVR